jgi:hypothetical protein
MKPKSQTRTIEAVIQFPKRLVGGVDLCGREFMIEIAGHKGVMVMPRTEQGLLKDTKGITKVSSIGTNLIQPTSKILKDLTTVEWGKMLSSKGVSSFQSCIIYFQFHKNQHYKVAAKKIAGEVDNYFSKLILYLEIITGINIESESKDGLLRASEPPFYAFNNGTINQVNNATFSVNVTLHGMSSGIQVSEVLMAIDYSNQGLEPNIAHKYIHDAKGALKIHDYRKSIIDAGTALEIALTRICESHLSKNNHDNFVKDVLKKYKTLGGRLTLADILNFDLTEKRELIYKKLVEPRNEAVHTGTVHNRTQIAQAVEIASTIVKKYCDYYE